MRNLTLNEKITLKGILSWKLGCVTGMVKGTMKDYLLWWGWCFGKSIVNYAKFNSKRIKR